MANKKVEAAEEKTTPREMPVCPICGKNDEVVPIAYGYPGFDMMMAAEKGEIKLGGCVLGSENFFCKRDSQEF